mmetsp:Transcript_12673/g.26249  ORF Transcript_12673/g.26249 Transcript_12673/m.26249 type:complete len:265 (+) Transcript_12673:112-906(+)
MALGVQQQSFVRSFQKTGGVWLIDTMNLIDSFFLQGHLSRGSVLGQVFILFGRQRFGQGRFSRGSQPPGDSKLGRGDGGCWCRRWWWWWCRHSSCHRSRRRSDGFRLGWWWKRCRGFNWGRSLFLDGCSRCSFRDVDIILKGCHILCFLDCDHDRRTDGDIVSRPGFHDEFCDITVILSFEINGSLVGFNLRQDISCRERIAFVNIPFGQQTGVHGRTQGGETHDNVIGQVAGQQGRGMKCQGTGGLCQRMCQAHHSSRRQTHS